MPPLVRAAGTLVLLFVALVPAASGANQKEIDRSLKAGAATIKAKYTNGAGWGITVNGANHGIGATCLSGLALLEAGVPANDSAIKTITGLVRDAAYTQTATYQIALCLMYLDRLGEPGDVPLIQALAVRLLVAQNAGGGWTYSSINAVSADDVKRLKAMKADQPAGTIHPEVKLYAQALTAARGQSGAAAGDDNSNTQFALLAVWMSRKHGVPVDAALELVEKRFMASQDVRTGSWAYSGGQAVGGGGGSPAMYCAGLLGMATGVARREEAKLESKLKDPPAPKKDAPSKPAKPTDPFYNPPATKEKEPEKKARPASVQDLTIQRAFAGLGLTLADMIRTGGILGANSTGLGHGDLYFLWSMERVGVVYGVEKIGGIDWFDLGSTVIVRTQSPDGSWNFTGGNYGPEVNTAFAVLFLARSNLARDLSSKVQRDPTSTEMRAGAGPLPTDVLPNRPAVSVKPIPVLDLPNPTGDEGITLASKMLKSNGADWTKLLEQAREAKGGTNTRALVLTATNTTDLERKKQVREALAERLCRMTPETLRTMMKSEQAELRRGAALACAMKDDKQHVPDLIELITDPDDAVTRAAKAGLKSLTGKDFGPSAEASAGQKALAATAWKEWYANAKEKK